MNNLVGIDGTYCLTKNAVFPLPEFHALCCPSCGVWKMYPRFVSGALLWKCSGPEVESDLLPGVQVGKGIGVICGKWHTDESIKSFIGLQMVEE